MSSSDRCPICDLPNGVDEGMCDADLFCSPCDGPAVDWRERYFTAKAQADAAMWAHASLSSIVCGADVMSSLHDIYPKHAERLIRERSENAERIDVD